MSTAFKVGVFAVGTLLGIFAVWYVLGNMGLRRNAYQMAIHFRNVVGLQPGSAVQLAGVDIGIVDSIQLQTDQTASVICSIHSDTTLYRGSVFTATQALTGGQSTLTIIPPPPAILATAIPIPKHVLPLAEQPEGTVPITIADLMNEGQKRLQDLDRTLSIVNNQLPGIMKSFNDVAAHTNGLIVRADKSFNLIGQQLGQTVVGINAVVAQLNGLLAVNGRNISAMTTNLNGLLAKNGPKVAVLIDNLSATSVSLSKTMATVQSIASDPNLKPNLLAATENLKESSEKLKAITSDIQGLTGDPKVQSQLRGTVKNLDETIEKANIILGNFVAAQGGQQAQPAPAGSPGQPAPAGSPAQSAPSGQPRPTSGRPAGAKGFNPFQLASGDVRIYWNQTPRGALSDVNITLLPGLPTHLTLGVETLGATSTYNFLVGRRGSPNLDYAGGILHSQLGLQTKWEGLGPFGARAELYNSRQPQLDLYGDLRLTQRLKFFYGEKAVMGPASNRSPQFGVQFGY